MRMEHGQSKLICEMCETSYFSRDGLTRHMKKLHKGENDATKRDLGDEGDKDKPIKESVTDKAEKEKVRKEELKRQVGPKNHLFLSDCLFGN